MYASGVPNKTVRRRANIDVIREVKSAFCTSLSIITFIREMGLAPKISLITGKIRKIMRKRERKTKNIITLSFFVNTFHCNAYQK